MASKTKPRHIVFFHPDLGIGGAERLVVDAAVGLQNRGHKITIFTSHCDPQHCFDEARDGTLDVRVRGNSIIPPSIFSRFSILCAILRQLHLILSIYLTSELHDLQPDAFFVDQLSAGLPVLRYLYPPTRTLFYCHFPDLLLAQGRAKWWKRVYRVPFDWIEQWSMSFADAVAVNSAFTKGVVGAVWPHLVRTKELLVVYPCVDVRETKAPAGEESKEESLGWRDTDIILSINRFEAKKDIGLAIRAFAGLSKESRKGVRLVIAGGYDSRVTENVTTHLALQSLAASLSLNGHTTTNMITALGISPASAIDVLFLLSVPNSLKDSLLKSAKLLVYTPANEHFGIVPLEAMLRGTPVLAANTGGPLETVVDGLTGWLRDPREVGEWTGVMERALHGLSEGERREMGRKGRERVVGEFSGEKMAERLEGIIEGMGSVGRRSDMEVTVALAVLGTVPVMGLVLVLSIWRLYGS